MPVKRLAVLYSNMAGYTAACLRALKAAYGTELLVYHWPISPEAPYTPETFAFIDRAIPKEQQPAEEIADTVRAFAPEAVLMSGWMDKTYLRAARQIKKGGTPVIAGCDTQWRGTLRQIAAAKLAPRYLHPAIDALWVSGERQRQFAHHLGYHGRQVFDGVYSCDWEAFRMPEKNHSRQRAFLYVGRYVEVKGLDVLLEAYGRYRSRDADPWPLWCAGTGPLAHLLDGQEGVENLGFVQPSDLPALMHRAGAFVLPSRWEPWGVVVHEAATAGLPLLCSDASGAAVHLLRSGFNGGLVGNGDVEHLAEGFRHLTARSPKELARYGQNSFELSRQYTPARWAATLVQGVSTLKV